MVSLEVASFMAGAILFANLIVGLYFMRFWAKTHDRFFLFFACAFFIFSIERLVLALANIPDETRGYFFLIRLAGFIFILAAIVDKNRSSRAPK